MTETARDQLNSFLHRGDQVIWSTAALVLAIQGAASDERQPPPCPRPSIDPDMRPASLLLTPCAINLANNCRTSVNATPGRPC